MSPRTSIVLPLFLLLALPVGAAEIDIEPASEPDTDIDMPEVAIPRPGSPDADERPEGAENPATGIRRPNTTELRRPQVAEPEILPPDPDVLRPDTEVLRPDPDIRRPDMEIRQPDTEIRRPDTGIGPPDMEIRRPSTDIRRPDLEIPRPDMDVPRPDLDIPRPDLDIRRPALESRPPADTSSGSPGGE